MDARLHVVEALYRYDLDELGHARLIQEAVARHWRSKVPIALVTGRVLPGDKFAPAPIEVLRSNGRDYSAAIRTGFPSFSIDLFREVSVAPPFYGSAFEEYRTTPAGASAVSVAKHTGVGEVQGFFGGTREGGIIGVMALLDSPLAMSQRERAYWQPVAAHLVSAWRLRQRFDTGATTQALTDAILLPDGKCLSSSRLHGPVCDRLREAVQKRESERDSAMSSQAMWSDLVDGRWTLVDHFEASGRRVVLALRNAASGQSLSRLTARESSALNDARLGKSNKEIALTMNLSQSSVTRLLESAARKLNATLADLLQFGAADTVRCRSLAFGETSLLMIAPATVDGWRAALTESEADVVAAALRGYSNRDIAALRGRSMRTVINQLASAFEKLGVQSRRELMSRCIGRDGTPAGK